MNEIGILEERIGVRFKNQALIKEALTHRSYLNEHPSWKFPHNERLEYLGDAVLELVVTHRLFMEFPEEPEGRLTVLRAALVNYQLLAKAAADFSLDSYMYMSKGERGDSSKAKEVILANAFESLVGAIYLDQGYEVVQKFIDERVLTHLPEILESRSYKDAKSDLQERIQERLRITPVYKVIEESGPAHKKTFKVGVYFGHEMIASGVGSSKQEAEVEAAKAALQKN